ncbi:hypothetical protein PHLGIDRAFT_16775 [Phlebiopsis gigantea 11061_1 CR5-6]|uniref:CCHC-type domain-containing protein n=1 Tax=Phlebiopsis gigantea (strain 11061_1 CR5-6) TaxID=745531 RepID=A0A0C3S2Y4_PHLG1|nr:hypothetical protein PHLGIDRAFT_16775 [Phlebiopsis gigantea 11061_1 CR5-6]
MATLSAADLPLLGTKRAPRKFNGQYSEVDRFLYHYNRLCQKYNVITDQEKIENITQYCSRKVREVLEGIHGLTGTDWTDFTNHIRKYFEADKEAKRYRINDVEVYVRESKQRSMKTLEHWNKYNRGFIRIVGWLKQEQRISDCEANFYFWKGIPRHFRYQLEPRIIIKNPAHNTKDLFTMRMVCAAAEALLSRDRFDMERLPSDEEDEEDEDLSNDSEASNGSNDEDKEQSRPPKYKKTHTTKSLYPKYKDPKHVSFREPPSEVASDSDSDQPSKAQRQHARKDKSTTAASEAPKDNQQEVEDLIQQLGRMSVDDPSYAMMYFRACSKNPLVKDIIPSPVVQQRSTALGGPNRPFDRQAPPHMDGSMQREPRLCFGCGARGHGMGMCPQLQELVAQGVIIRDNQGRFAMKNGQPIRKISFDEPLVQAITRANGSSTHFVGVPSSDENDDQDDRDVYWGHQANIQDYWSDDEDDIAPYVYDVAERPKRTIRATRKAKESTAWVPHRKESGVRETARPGRPVSRTPEPTPAPIRERVPFNFVPVPRPVTPIFNPADDRQIIEDTPEPTPSTPPTSTKPDPQPAKDVPMHDARTIGKTETEKRQPRRSELQTLVDPKIMLDRVLRAPITVAIGELLAVSREMTSQFQDVIKFRSARHEKEAEARPSVRLVEAPSALEKRITLPKSVSAAAFMPRSRGQLIQIPLECNGERILAIVDTGSQLNIVNRGIWKSRVSQIRPMDITRRLVMNDASGGESMLEGLVSDVPLTCGGVRTTANLYVGPKAPFDLLLGRPWQRGNFVSIDERIEGTYLLFKDKNLHVNFEMLVTPDLEIDQKVLDYINTAHAAVGMCALDEEEAALLTWD